MTDHTEAERAKFEGVCRAQKVNIDWWVDSGCYRNTSTQSMWMGWVSRATLESAPSDLLEEAMKLARLYSAADANSVDYRGDDKAVIAKLGKRVVESQVALRKFLAAHLRATAASDNPAPLEAAARIAVDAWQSGHMLAEAMDALMDHLGMPDAPAVVSQQLQTEAAGAAPPAQQWLPIETAPKDHHARLYRTNAIVVQGFVDVTGAVLVQNEKHEWRAMRGKPTHWMPLPPAPQHQGGGQ